jgi:hypothetical protein
LPDIGSFFEAGVELLERGRWIVHHDLRASLAVARGEWREGGHAGMETRWIEYADRTFRGCAGAVTGFGH